MKTLTVHADTLDLIVEANPDGFTLNGTPVGLDIIQRNGNLLTVRYGNKIFNVFCKKIAPNRFEVWIRDHVIQVTTEDSIAQMLAQYQKQAVHQTARLEIRAPMPGLVTSIAVETGQIVEKEAKLATLEAMKMENEIRSPMRGVVKKIEVAKGAKVEKEQRLIILEEVTETA